MKKSLKYTAAAVVAVVAAGSITASFASPTVDAHRATAQRHWGSVVNAQALSTLNSFYKPALKGQFPAFNGFTVGVTTKDDVIKTIGRAPQPGTDSDAFDVYHGEMGHPGYAISYKLDRIREMRYYGTRWSVRRTSAASPSPC